MLVDQCTFYAWVQPVFPPTQSLNNSGEEKKSVRKLAMKCVRDNLFTSTIRVWTIHNLSVFPHRRQKWLIAFSYTHAIASGRGIGGKCYTNTKKHQRIGREEHAPKYCCIKQEGPLCREKQTPQSYPTNARVHTLFAGITARINI